MQNLIPLGTGNSRFMKSNISPSTTLEQLIQMLNNGTFPYDIGQMNPAGISQQGTPLNKDTLLQDAVATLYGLQNTAVPNDVFNILAGTTLFKPENSKNGLSDWTLSTNPVPNRYMTQFAYNGIVAVAADITNGAGWVSYDKGKTWASQKIFQTTGSDYAALTEHNGIIYAVNRTNASQIYTSTDGDTWLVYTDYSGLTGTAFKTWFYGENLYVLASDNQTIHANHGVDPADLPYPASYYCEPVIVNNTVYFLPESGNQLMYSSDGITWNTTELPISTNWGALAYKNGIFVASCETGTYEAYWSSDGINWTPGPLYSTGDTCVIAGQDYFLLPRAKLYSPDGQTWMPYTSASYPTSASFGASFGGIMFLPDYSNPANLYWAQEEVINPPMFTDTQGNQLVVNPGQVAAGSYIGSGTYGQDNPTQIPFPDFTPQLVVVVSESGYNVGLYGTSGILIWVNGMTSTTVAASGSESTTLYTDYQDGVLSIYTTENAYSQLNNVGQSYYYFGIGGISS